MITRTQPEPEPYISLQQMVRDMWLAGYTIHDVKRYLGHVVTGLQPEHWKVVHDTYCTLQRVYDRVASDVRD
jgi:hypothetical protein